MICSVEEAQSLFKKWQDEGADLRCAFFDNANAPGPSGSWYLRGQCSVVEVSEALVLALFEEAAFRVPFDSVMKISFGAPVEIGSLLSEDSAEYGSWLSILLRKNLLLVVAERKSNI
jgi:hypothetical protein